MKKNSHRLNSFIGEVTLFIIHFYFGIYSFFDMLFEKYGIRLYFTLFWDHENKTSKPENYVKLAIAYQYHPILCILVTITICILILVLSIIVTIGVIYMYKWEMEAECV